MQIRQHEKGVRSENLPVPGVSGVMLLAIVVVLFMGVNIVFVRDNPHWFAGFLILVFVFFFVAAVLAIDDIGRIATAAVKRRNEIYRRTVCDETFYGELRAEVRRRMPAGNGTS